MSSSSRVDRSPLLLNSASSSTVPASAASSPTPRQSFLAQLPATQLSSTRDGDFKALTSPPSSPSNGPSTPRLPPSSSLSISSIVLSRYHRRHSTLLLSLLLLAFLTLYAVSERGLLTGSNTPLLPSTSLAHLNNASLFQFYFGPNSTASNATHRTRVVYCIIDGLRYDALTTNPALSSFLSSLAPDALTLPMRAQIPTISIPNWLTLLTGTTPTMHGRSGNDVTDAAPFSSLFSTTSQQGRPNGLTASQWWAELFAPSLTPFRGDGAYSDEVDWGEAVYRRGMSSAVRDAFSTSRLMTAIASQHRREGRDSQFDYELFLAYWEDVDAESHAWGGTSQQTQQAAATIIDFIRQAMQAVRAADEWSAAQGGVQWRSIFVITADHGHVDVGGHGGEVDVLTTVPLIIYSNHSTLASLTSHLPPVPAFYQPTTCDIATTIAALCGVPVPRQSEGMFLPSVLSAFLDVGPRAWLHYFDLFMQKRALVMEATQVMGESGVLNDDLLAIPPQPSFSSSNLSAALVDLNERTGRLLEAFDRAKDAQLSAQLAVNWTVATVILCLLLLPLVCWVYDRRTFLTVSAVFPQQLSSSCFHLSFLIRSALLRAWRRIGGHAALPSPDFFPLTPASVRINRVAAAVGFGLTSLWVLLMMFDFLVVFRFSYRSTAAWSWQFTLFNSTFDAYVLLFVFCMLAALLACIALHIAAAVIIKSDRLSQPLLSYIHSSHVQSPTAKDHGPISRAPQGPLRVLVYFVVQWTSLWCAVLSLLFLYSQSYHCLFLPYFLPISYLTPSIWRHRFQSWTFGFMLLVGAAYCAALAVWVEWRLHQFMWRTVRERLEGDKEGEEDEKWEETEDWRGGSDEWRREKHEALWAMGRLKRLSRR